MEGEDGAMIGLRLTLGTFLTAHKFNLMMADLASLSEAIQRICGEKQEATVFEKAEKSDKVSLIVTVPDCTNDQKQRIEAEANRSREIICHLLDVSAGEIEVLINPNETTKTPAIVDVVIPAPCNLSFELFGSNNI